MASPSASSARTARPVARTLAGPDRRTVATIRFTRYGRGRRVGWSVRLEAFAGRSRPHVDFLRTSNARRTGVVVPCHFATARRVLPQIREGSPVKRTFQPNKRRRHKKHGFRSRMKTRAGRRIVQRRRKKGRQRLGA